MPKGPDSSTLSKALTSSFYGGDELEQLQRIESLKKD